MDNKLIFSVTLDKQDGAEEHLDQSNFNLTIGEGVTGNEMIHGITTLLLAVLAHENENGNDFSIDGFTAFLANIMKETEIGVPTKK